MNIVQYGLSHEVAPIAVRERVAFSGQTALEALAAFPLCDALPEVALLSTCNRTEFYGVAEDTERAQQVLIDFMTTTRGLSAEEVTSVFTWRVGQEAVDHLFRVAAGLESQILGEGQILGQVRDAAETARNAGTFGPVLDNLFRSAISTGKRVRSETAISQGPVSIGAAAVEQAKDDLGGLAGRSALLIGAGKLGELALKHLAAQGVSRIVVANRTLESASELAKVVGGEAIPFMGMEKTLIEVDVVFCCTGAPHFVLDRADFQPIALARGGRGLVVVDVSVPRNIDPAVGTLPGITVHDIDDLVAIADRGRSERAFLVPQVEQIVTEELGRFEAYLRGYHAAPTIASLRQKLETLRTSEVERFLSRFGEGLSAEQIEAVEALTRAIAAKFLHEPTVGLKERGNNGPHASAIRELFGLTPSRPRRHSRTAKL